MRFSVRKSGWADKQDLGDFAAAGFTSQHALDVVALLAMKTISNYANHLAGTPLDQPFEKFRWQGRE
jgi:alkylhydroperoxidase family enzyme